jgi:AcrR family transcriptional regulator
MSRGKKEQIVDTARQLFWERGVLATSMDDIAAQVPVSKMTIYKHFGSKEALVAEVMDRYVRQLHELMNGAIDSAPDAMAALLQIMNYDDKPLPERFVKETLETYPHIVERIMRYYEEQIEGQFERLIFEAQRQGSIRKDIAPFFIMLYVKAFKAFFAQPDVVHQLGDMKQAGEQIRTMFLYGIVAPEARPRVE